MTSTSDPLPIFENGKLRPGIYKIQNIYSDTYLDIEVHSREVCCRPRKDIEEGRGLWEIKQLGDGYTVQRVDRGNPVQFCTPLNGLQAGAKLCVTAYPVAWRIETVENDQHRGFNYVRFSWATTKAVWDLAAVDRRANGASVQTHAESSVTWQIWRLIPVGFGTADPVCLRAYDGNPGGSSTQAQNTESGSDELGTFVNEVTVVTTTVTTRKRYRVEDSQV